MKKFVWYMLHVNMNESESMKSLADIPMHTHAQEVLDFDWVLQAMVLFWLVAAGYGDVLIGCCRLWWCFDWLLQAMVMFWLVAAGYGVGFWLVAAGYGGGFWLVAAGYGDVLIGCCRLWWCFDWLLQAMVLGFDWLLQAIVLIGCCRLWWHEPVDRGPQQGWHRVSWQRRWIMPCHLQTHGAWNLHHQHQVCWSACAR